MIGFKQKNKERNMIKNQRIVTVNNLKELEKIRKGEIAVIGKIGMKKKIGIAKRAKEKGIPIHNLNVNKMLKKIQKKETKNKTEKKGK